MVDTKAKFSIKTLKAPQMVIIPQQLYNMFNLYNCGGPGVTK